MVGVVMVMREVVVSVVMVSVIVMAVMVAVMVAAMMTAMVAAAVAAFGEGRRAEHQDSHGCQGRQGFRHQVVFVRRHRTPPLFRESLFLAGNLLGPTMLSVKQRDLLQTDQKNFGRLERRSRRPRPLSRRTRHRSCPHNKNTREFSGGVPAA